jgi:hypothetical protein
MVTFFLSGCFLGLRGYGCEKGRYWPGPGVACLSYSSSASLSSSLSSQALVLGASVRLTITFFRLADASVLS